jgi:hypothetical protein
MTILAIFPSTHSSSFGIDDAGYYIIRQMAKCQPENQFFLLSPDFVDSSANNIRNVKHLTYKPSRWNLLERRNMRNQLTSIKADLCMVVEEANYISLNFPVTRWVIAELNQQHEKWLSHPQNQWNLCVEPDTEWKQIFEARQISYQILNPFTERYRNSYSETEKQAFKEKHTGGDDFVLFNFMGIKEEEIQVTMLKAFTQFKQWNKTGMKLLIGCTSIQEDSFRQLLQSYKLRSDVILLMLKDEATWDVAIASSFLLADFSNGNKLSASMLRALKHGVPLIVKETNYFQSLMKDAVLYANADVAGITAKLTLVYKDEQGNADRRKCYDGRSSGVITKLP